jgi:hypothetical protein
MLYSPPLRYSLELKTRFRVQTSGEAGVFNLVAGDATVAAALVSCVVHVVSKDDVDACVQRTTTSTSSNLSSRVLTKFATAADVFLK